MSKLRVAGTILFLVAVLAILVSLRLKNRKQQSLLNATAVNDIRPEFKKGEVPRIQAPSDPQEFVDLTFGTGQIRPDSDGMVVIPVRATFEQEEIGFSVKLPSEISAGLTGRGSDFKVKLVPQGVELLREVEIGDRFVTALEKLYRVGEHPLKMAQRVKISAVNLASNDQAIDRDLVQLKLFFNDQAGNEEDYAECYLNLDLSHNYVQLAEKDADYRKPLVKALAAE